MNQKKIRSRKQLTSINVFICPTCDVDLVPTQYIDNVSGELFIKTKHVCTSRENCNFEYEE